MLIRQSEFARRCGLHRSYICQPVKEGVITLIDGWIDPEKTLSVFRTRKAKRQAATEHCLKEKEERRYRVAQRKREKLETLLLGRKKCRECLEEKSTERFRFKKKYQYFEPVCKDCRNKHQREDIKVNPEKYRKRRKVFTPGERRERTESRRQKRIETYQKNGKRCSKCGKILDLSKFELRSHGVGYESQCHKCRIPQKAERQHRRITNLVDSYVARRLMDNFSLTLKEIPSNLIALKREQMLLERLLKQTRKEAHYGIN